MQNERPRKLQRISQACDLCHRRSIRCRPSTEEGERCQNCYDFDVACTYDRPSKRRKHPQAPAAPRDPNTSTASSSTAAHGSLSGGTGPLTAGSGSSTSSAHRQLPVASAQTAIPDFVDPSTIVSPAHARVDLVNNDQSDNWGGHGAHVVLQMDPKDTLDVSWKAFALSSEPSILELFDVFVQVIYPLYPVLDRSTIRKRIERREHLTNKGFFACIMACCALTSARMRDGAYSGPITDALRRPEVSSEIFFHAAREAMPADVSGITNKDTAEYISACTLLSLTCIQYGQSSGVQQYLGHAFTMAAMKRFYDEQSWPQDLDEQTKEMYRRVYWCTYMLDVYSAIVWNCFLRGQEIHAYVRYPNDVNEENLITNLSPGASSPVSWIIGWNFSLDLYRVLEHVVNKARTKKFHHDDRRSVDSLVFADTFSDRDVMQTMLNMYYELPRQFKETLPMTGDLRKDIFGFQAANIQATLQLLRMMLFSLEDGPGVERKCDVANEVLQVFHTIPIPYLKAISSPLIYQLGSIGMVLGSVLEEALSQPVYERVRNALVLMADLLQNLESNLHRSAGAAEGLRVQVQKLDEYMQKRRGGPPLHSRAPEQRHGAPQSASGVSSDPGGSQPSAQDSFAMPDFQILPELRMEWPWQFFQPGQGNYYGDQMGAGSTIGSGLPEFSSSGPLPMGGGGGGGGSGIGDPRLGGPGGPGYYQ